MGRCGPILRNFISFRAFRGPLTYYSWKGQFDTSKLSLERVALARREVSQFSSNLCLSISISWHHAINRMLVVIVRCGSELAEDGSVMPRDGRQDCQHHAMIEKGKYHGMNGKIVSITRSMPRSLEFVCSEERKKRRKMKSDQIRPL